MFVVTGPGSPGVKTQMIASIEQHVDWIADCIGHLREHGFDRIEAAPQAELDWVQHVNQVADSTLYPLANSWYMGANIPGKPRVFMPYVGGYDRYKRHCDAIAAKGYEGFRLTRHAHAVLEPARCEVDAARNSCLSRHTGEVPPKGAEGEGHTGDLRRFQIGNLQGPRLGLSPSGPAGRLPRMTGEVK